MMAKDRDEHSCGNVMEEAGAKAEEQMAFYLRRAFGQDKNVYVYNDLRLVDAQGESTQFDHLIFHRRARCRSLGIAGLS